MAMLDLFRLPPEIIQEMADKLPWHDQKTLRLVCTYLNRVLEASILSSIVIEITTHNPSTTKVQLETLATQNTRASKHTQKLIIKCLNPYMAPASLNYRPEEREAAMENDSDTPTADVVEQLMKKYLSQALLSLKNVESVTWTMNPCDLFWTYEPVVGAISCLPINTFNLSLSEVATPALQLTRLSGLRKISFFARHRDSEFLSQIVASLAEVVANSPRLSYLQVVAKREDRISLDDILSTVASDSPLQLNHLFLNALCVPINSVTLPHLRHLSSLDLSNVIDFEQHSQSESTEIMPTVTNKKVYTIPDIFACLSRERIHLRRLVIDYVCDALLDYLCSYSGILEELCFHHLRSAPSSTLGERFYASVLPKHVGSIQTLDIRAISEGWLYTNHVPSILFQCSKLRYLTVEVDPTSAANVCNELVSSIMDLSMSVWRLTHVHLELGPIRSTERGNRWMRARQTLIRAVRESITKFSHRDPPLRGLPLIQFEAKVFRFLRGSDGTWKYRVSEGDALWA